MTLTALLVSKSLALVTVFTIAVLQSSSNEVVTNEPGGFRTTIKLCRHRLEVGSCLDASSSIRQQSTTPARAAVALYSLAVHDLTLTTYLQAPDALVQDKPITSSSSACADPSRSRDGIVNRTRSQAIARSSNLNQTNNR